MTRQLGVIRYLRGAAAMSAVGLASALCASGAQARETFKVAVVSFPSAQAAESFGIPAVTGTTLLVGAFNNGAAPARYNEVG